MPEEPVLPERELRARVIRRMEDGRLPLTLPTRINAGYGSGARCDLCDQPIAAHKVEYEIADARSGKRLYFHVACHSIWQRECQLRIVRGGGQTPP
jgi:hypothetical protein